MKKKNEKVNNNVEQTVVYTAILVILLLSAFNIQYYLGKRNVLGSSVVIASGITEDTSDRVFWEDFVHKNPNYIPGWIELGRMDKVREIDPNYQ